jgi:hypothetical protein
MRNSRPRSVAVVAVALVGLALGACSDEDPPPGGSPPTLYEETILIDPTPTTTP